MTVATDPANQFGFRTKLPITDYAARTLGVDKAAYFKQYDTDKDNPMVRDGLLWEVELIDK